MSSAFIWDENRSRAAILLAEGRTQKEVAEEIGMTDRVIRKWLIDPEFAAEVDRLSLMVGVSSRAERLRIAMRVARDKVRDDGIDTEKDLLDWLKFAQSETDGVKLDITKIAAALGEDEALVADSGSPRLPPATEETVN